MKHILLIPILVIVAFSAKAQDKNSSSAPTKKPNDYKWLEPKTDWKGQPIEKKEPKTNREATGAGSTGGMYKSNTQRAKESADEIQKHIEEKGVAK